MRAVECGIREASAVVASDLPQLMVRGFDLLALEAAERTGAGSEVIIVMPAKPRGTRPRKMLLCRRLHLFRVNRHAPIRSRI